MNNGTAICVKCGNRDSAAWMFMNHDTGYFTCEDCHYKEWSVCEDCMESIPKKEIIYNVFYDCWLCPDCNTVILK